jgi:hypothetical protein
MVLEMKKRQQKKIEKKQKQAISEILDRLIDQVKKKKVSMNELSSL